MFKDFYSKNKEEKIKLLDEMFSLLSEDDSKNNGEYLKLTTSGKEQIFNKNFEDIPDIGPTNRFKLLSAKTDKEEIKSLIKSKKAKGKYKEVFSIRLVPKAGVSRGNIRMTQTDVDSDIFNFPRGMISSYFSGANDNWTKVPKDEKEKIDNISERDSRAKNAGEGTNRNFIRIDKSELNIILDVLNKYYTDIFAKGAYYLYDVGTEILYKVVFNAKDEIFAKSNLFEPYEEYKGPIVDEKGKVKGFKLDTKAGDHETIQVLGFFFDTSVVRADLEELQDVGHFDANDIPSGPAFEKAIKPFVEAMNKNEDYKLFIRVVKEAYKYFSFADWYYILDFAGAASFFAKKVLQTNDISIIHGSINDFKEVESKSMFYKNEETYGKTSTVDCIISKNLTKDKIFSLVADDSVSLRSGDGVVDIVKAGKVVGSYYQISLKSPGASLGRIQRFFAKTYKMAIKSKELYDNYATYEELISESLLSTLVGKAKEGVEALKKLGKSFYDKVRALIVKLSNWKNSTIKKIEQLQKSKTLGLATELYNLTLTEDAKNDLIKVVDTCMQSPDKYFDIGNNKICLALRRISGSKYASMYKAIVEYPSKKDVKDYNKNLFVNQIINYSFLEAFDEVLLHSENPIEEYIDELLNIYIEAIFGSTILPVWKVKTLFDDIPYEYLGTKEGTKEERKENILKNLNQDGMHLIILKADSITNGVNNLQLYIISNIISEDGAFYPKYTRYEIKRITNNVTVSFSAKEELDIRDLPKEN